MIEKTEYIKSQCARLSGGKVSEGGIKYSTKENIIIFNWKKTFFFFFLTKTHYYVGLKKIEEASVTLEELNSILAVQRVKVAEQTKNCEQLLASIGKSTDVAMAKKEISTEKREEIEEQNKVIAKESAEAKEALAEAQPALNAARIALGELEKGDITEIRLDRFLDKTLIFLKNRKITLIIVRMTVS